MRNNTEYMTQKTNEYVFQLTSTLHAASNLCNNYCRVFRQFSVVKAGTASVYDIVYQY